MSLKFLHSVIIFAAFSLSLFVAYWCFSSPDAQGDSRYFIAGIAAVIAAIALVGYEIHFLKKTKGLIIH